MKKACAKCGYEKPPSDTAPEYECPKCGSIYAASEAAVEKKSHVAPTESRPSASCSSVPADEIENPLGNPSDLLANDISDKQNDKRSISRFSMTAGLIGLFLLFCGVFALHIEWGWVVLSMGCALSFVSAIAYKKQASSFSGLINSKNRSDDAGSAAVSFDGRKRLQQLLKRNKKLVSAIAIAALLGVGYAGYNFLRGVGIKGQVRVATADGESLRRGAVTIFAYRKSDFDKYVSADQFAAAKKDAQFEAALEAAKMGGMESYQITLAEQLAYYAKEAENPFQYTKFSLLKPIATTTSDAEGEFRLDLLPGDYVLAATTVRRTVLEPNIQVWMFYVDSKQMRERIVITNSNDLLRDDKCPDCIKPIGDSESRTARIRQLKTAMKQLDQRLLVEQKKAEAAGEAARIRAEQMDRNERDRQARIAERQARLARRESIGLEMDKLRSITPDFDSSYRAPKECHSDNVSMQQLLVCRKARVAAKEAHEQRYADAQIRLQELEHERLELLK